jgi:hypothetical protein
VEYQNKVRYCLQLLKEQIKNSAINYQQLADKLAVSVLTIKRQLNGEEISMGKLLALCDASQVNFSELWQKVENRVVEDTVFSKEQDFAFYHFPHLFHFFIELANNKTPESIRQQWQLTPASNHLYLRKLEQLKLISLSEQGKPTILLADPIGFGPESLCVIQSIQESLKQVSDNLITPNDNEPFIIAKPMMLDENLREKMYQELKELVSRYAELSERYYLDANLPSHNLVICDYKMHQEPQLAEIININGFELIN